jgi:hypothetical protein
MVRLLDCEPALSRKAFYIGTFSFPASEPLLLAFSVTRCSLPYFSCYFWFPLAFSCLSFMGHLVSLIWASLSIPIVQRGRGCVSVDVLSVYVNFLFPCHFLLPDFICDISTTPGVLSWIYPALMFAECYSIWICMSSYSSTGCHAWSIDEILSYGRDILSFLPIMPLFQMLHVTFTFTFLLLLFCKCIIVWTWTSGLVFWLIPLLACLVYQARITVYDSFFSLLRFCCSNFPIVLRNNLGRANHFLPPLAPVQIDSDTVLVTSTLNIRFHGPTWVFKKKRKFTRCTYIVVHPWLVAHQINPDDRSPN